MSTQRDDILGCACELFAEEGLDGFSMRRLARSVGVTAPALYRHFDGKEEVLGAVVGEAFKVLAGYLYDSLGAPTPMGRLMGANDAYLDFALDHPRYYETIHAPLEAMGIEELPDGVYAQACSVGQFWLDRLRELVDEELIREADPQRVSLTMWAHGHGLISLYRRGMMAEMDEATFRRVYRESTIRALRGVATDAGVAAAEATDRPAHEGDEEGEGEGDRVPIAPSGDAAAASTAAAAPGVTGGDGSGGVAELDRSSPTNGDGDGDER